MRLLLLCCLTSCGFLPELFPYKCLRDLDCKTDEFCEREAARCVPREVCDGGADEDQDGLRDCEDLLDCFAAPGCAAAGQVTRLSLGEVSVGEEVSFPIPEGAVGFTLLVSGGEDNVLGVQRLVAPGGEVRVSGFEEQELRQFNAYEAFGFIVPQGDNDQNEVTPGVWRLTLGASVAEPLEVELRVRMGPVSAGAFALNFYLPRGLRMCERAACEDGAGSPVTPANAATFAELAGLLHTLSEGALSQLGIGVGAVNFFEIDEEFLLISSREELAAMFQHSTAPGGLNLFLVQGFSQGDFSGTLAGVSSGIPGAVGTSGNKNSGVALKVALDPEFTNNINGMVAAHEVGHFLGLWHTTEFDGKTDLLEDTPACSLEVMLSDAALCPDFHHVMFPSLAGWVGVLSESQQHTIRAGVGYQ